ncbi:MFS transporter [bacterium]|nr:MAG: MFS transporter [bacterium]
MQHDVENPFYWAKYGRKLAWINLLIASFSLMLSFMVWQLWSVLVLYLNSESQLLNQNQLYALTIVPFVAAAILRLAYTFWATQDLGKWNLIKTTSLLIVPVIASIITVWLKTSFLMYLVASVLTGIAGANFASTMIYVNHLFPHRYKSMALGLSASIGNAGIGLIQVLGFLIKEIQSHSGLLATQYIEPSLLILSILLGLVFLAVIIAILVMPNMNFSVDKTAWDFSILKDKHSWYLSLFYAQTFGMFMGITSIFPINTQTYFSIHISNELYIFPIVIVILSSALRPLGHYLAHHFGSVKVTIYVFVAQLFGLLCLSYSFELTNYWFYLISTLMICISCGIGMGSSTSLITDLYQSKYVKELDDKSESTHKASMASSIVIGFSSAIGTIGALVPGISISVSESLSQDATFGILGMILFCGFGLITLGMVYQKHDLSNPFCIIKNGKYKLIDSPKKAL